MSTPEEWTPMDRTTAEKLLRGDRTGHPLDRVLAAARAPATGHELAGEAAATAAFRAAAQEPAGRRPALLRSVLGRMLTLKVVAAAFATSATVGGVALAANTDTLSSPISVVQPSVTVSRPPSVPSTAPAAPPATTPAARPATSSTAPPVTSPPRSRTPDRVAELCRELDRHGRDRRWQALDDDHFGELMRRAGGDRDRVERYCGIRPGDSRPPWADGDRDDFRRGDDSSAGPRR